MKNSHSSPPQVKKQNTKSITIIHHFVACKTQKKTKLKNIYSLFPQFKSQNTKSITVIHHLLKGNSKTQNQCQLFVNSSL
jgi:hypothetical protein